jgi:peptide/nickel transport system substrate-binding protein
MRSTDEQTNPGQVRVISRRRFTALAAASAGAALLAACGGSSTAPTATSGASATRATGSTPATGAATTTSATTATGAGSATTGGSSPTVAAVATGQPAKGGTLVYARNIDAKTLDPHFSAQFSERHMLYLIYNTLVAYDKDFNLVPDLAASWDVGDGGKSVTFKLRPNAKFHDGTDCDAAAIKWNYDRILDDKINAPVRSSLQPPLKSVDVVDKTTVRFNLDQPWRPLIAALGDRPGFIVSPTAVQKYGQDYGRNPVGSGPYKFVEWVTDNRIVVQRFDGYWDQGKPYLDRIEMRHVPDSQVQLTQIRTGEAQLIDAIDPSLVSTIRSASGVVVEEYKGGRYYGTQMHPDKPPFDNADLRQALAYATNRAEIQQAVYNGTGRLATHPIGVGWAYDQSLDSKGYQFDLAQAKDQLTKSGAAGQTFTYTASSSRQAQTIAQVLQAQYQKLGITINIETVNPADSFALVKSGKTNWTDTNFAPRADPDGLLRILWHSKGFQNSTGFNDPEVDKLLDQAAGLYETKQAAPLYSQVEQRVVANASHIFHIWGSEFAAHRTEVKGFQFYPDLILRLRDYSISK